MARWYVLTVMIGYYLSGGSCRALITDGNGDLTLVSKAVHDLRTRRAMGRDSLFVVHIHVPTKISRSLEFLETNLALEKFLLVPDFEVCLISPEKCSTVNTRVFFNPVSYFGV